jgi:Fe-S-cluster containining protein
MEKKIPVDIKITPENKCGFCTNSKCCTYITEELATPRSMHDFDHMLWQLSHKDVQAYKDEEGWYLLVNNPCLHLGKDGRCGIYEDRPQICREYSNDFCEFDESADEGFELFFENTYASDSRPGTSTVPAGTASCQRQGTAFNSVPACTC